jgi:hypothetical protein
MLGYLLWHRPDSDGFHEPDDLSACRVSFLPALCHLGDMVRRQLVLIVVLVPIRVGVDQRRRRSRHGVQETMLRVLRDGVRIDDRQVMIDDDLALGA